MATTSELIRALALNQQTLDRDEDYFKVAVSGLSNLRRTHAFEYVTTLKARIKLLEHLREAEAELVNVANQT